MVRNMSLILKYFRSRKTMMAILVTVLFYIIYEVCLFGVKYHQFSNICEKMKSSSQRCEKVNPNRATFQQLLLKWISLTKERNISYVLSSGSLLGQSRNKDVIPWDHDLDILVEDTSYNKLQNITTPRIFVQGKDDLIHFVVQPEYEVQPPTNMRRWNCRNEVVNGQPDHCSFIGPIARMIKGFVYLDIFGVNIKDGWAFEGYEKLYFRVSDLFPARDCFLMGILTKCPQNSQKVLQTFYSFLEQPCHCVNGEWKVRLW